MTKLEFDLKPKFCNEFMCLRTFSLESFVVHILFECFFQTLMNVKIRRAEMEIVRILPVHTDVLVTRDMKIHVQPLTLVLVMYLPCLSTHLTAAAQWFAIHLLTMHPRNDS